MTAEGLTMVEEQQVWRFTAAGVTRDVIVEDTGNPGALRYAAGRHLDRPTGCVPEDALMRYAMRAGHLDVCEILAPGVPTRAELLAERDAVREDYAAAVEYLAGIVRAWQRASDEDRRMADVFVSGMRREIEEARGIAQGEWWEKTR